jgi:hypothetical protein
MPYDCRYVGGKATPERFLTCPLRLDHTLSSADGLFTWARRVNGDENQVDKAMEECSEFITVMLQYRQGRAIIADVVDEIADVMIMMAQMRTIYGEREIDARLKVKLKRLGERVLPSIEGVDQ